MPRPSYPSFIFGACANLSDSLKSLSFGFLCFVLPDKHRFLYDGLSYQDNSYYIAALFNTKFNLSMEFDHSLIGKNALVCGGSKGIGKAIGKQLASMGANVILLARNADTLLEAVHELPLAPHQKHRIIIADTSDHADLAEKIKALLASFPIHILINNSGGPAGGSLMNSTAQDFLNAYQSHLLANHLFSTLVVPQMKKSGHGRIINIISTSVKIPLKGLGVSNTTRGAVASWAKTLATELAPFGITVNNVLPGATSTERLDEIIAKKASNNALDKSQVIEEMKDEIPMGRFGSPEEIAAAVGFLASPAAAYITGINLPVDGGRLGCL